MINKILFSLIYLLSPIINITSICILSYIFSWHLNMLYLHCLFSSSNSINPCELAREILFFSAKFRGISKKTLLKFMRAAWLHSSCWHNYGEKKKCEINFEFNVNYSDWQSCVNRHSCTKKNMHASRLCKSTGSTSDK